METQLVYVKSQKGLQAASKQKYSGILVTRDLQVEESARASGWTIMKPDACLDPKNASTILKNSRQMIKDWGEIRLENGEKVQEFLQEGDLDLWESLTLGIRGMAINEYESVQGMEMAIDLITKTKPGKLWLETTDTALGLALQTTARTKGLPVDVWKNSLKKKLYQSVIYPRAAHWYKWMLSRDRRKSAVPANQFKKGKKARILVYLNLASFLPALLPIIKALREKKEYEVIVMNGDETKENKRIQQAIKETKVLYVDLESFETREHLHQTRELQRVYARKMRTVSRSASFRDGIRYKGIPAWSVFKEGLQYYLPKRARYSEVLERSELVRKAIEELQPSLIISADSAEETSFRAFREAHERGVKIMFVEHGLRQNLIMVGLHEASFVDAFAAWGPYETDLPMIEGFDKRKIIVTGHPHMDSIKERLNDQSIIEERVRKKFNLPENRKILLLTTTASGERNTLVTLMVLKAIQGLLDYFVIIKKHPRDYIKTKTYEKWMRKENIEGRVVEGDLYDFFAVSSVNVNCSTSTVILEALVFGKSTIIVPTMRKTMISGLAKKGVLIGVESTREMRAAILKMSDLKKHKLAVKKGESVIHKYFNTIDGKVTHRVIRIVDQLIREQKKKREIK